MPCFASSLLDSNRRQRALQISAGPIGQGDYYQPVRCLVLVYDGPAWLRAAAQEKGTNFDRIDLHLEVK